MTDQVFVGYPRKRTERTAAAEAVRMTNEWWAGLGHPEVRVEATGVVKRMRSGGWSVEVRRIA